MCESLQVALLKEVAILMMLAKSATLGFLKIMVLLNKVYDVVISAHDVNDKISSHNSYHIVDLVIWSNFGNCSLSMREVTKIYILKRFDQKNQFF